MILAGTLEGSPEPIRVRLSADTPQDQVDFVRYITETARRTMILDVKLEVMGLSPDGVWAKFYVRGAMDPDFADVDAVDHYLRVLTRIDGDRGHAARTGFLQGWAEHRVSNDHVRLLPWHRLLGGRAVTVGRAA